MVRRSPARPGPGEYGEELEGLQLIVTLWVLRDIRVHIPKFFIRDTKRQELSTQRQRQRRHAMVQFLSAITLVADAEGSDAPQPRVLHRTHERLLASVPAGIDRSLVRVAVATGMDVFMTRDAGVLDARGALRLLGIVVASPLDLVEEFAAAGSMDCRFDPRALYWPMPDQQRLMYLMSALHQDP